MSPFSQVVECTECRDRERPSDRERETKRERDRERQRERERERKTVRQKEAASLILNIFLFGGELWLLEFALLPALFLQLLPQRQLLHLLLVAVRLQQ